MARQNFGGFGGGGNMQQLMRQAQKLQEQMGKAQEELDAKEYEAASGGGMVKVKVSGTRQILSLEIDPSVIDADDKEILEDMIMAAANEALRTAEETREAAMARLSPGMGGMF
jgi:DNA-binding protein, YbaB/EbfC family